MASYQISAARARGVPLARPVEFACIALIVAHAVYLAASFWQGSWLIAPDGSGLPTDFVNVWAAGRLALAGHAAAAYDWPTHKAMEVVALGHPFAGYFGIFVCGGKLGVAALHCGLCAVDVRYVPNLSRGSTRHRQ
jgi:hypothetical protein